MRVPISKPARRAPRESARNWRKKMAQRTSAAKTMRTALKTSGVASASADLMTMKVEPQTKVAASSRRWALSERDIMTGWDSGVDLGVGGGRRRRELECASSGGEPGEEEDEQGETLERLLASGRIEPLVKGVGSAAGAAGAEGNRLEAEGERDVGVGGGAQELRLDAKLRVDGADGGQQRRGGRQLSGRTLANHGDGVVETGAGLRRMGLRLGAGIGNGAAEKLLEFVDAQGIGGAEIDLEDGALGNGVDGGSALDASDIERGAGIDGQRDAEERADDERGGDDGIGRAVIAPGMAARACNDDLKAAAAKSLRDDVVGAGAIEGDEQGDGRAGVRIGDGGGSWRDARGRGAACHADCLRPLLRHWR